jgi:hypothetical protein
LIANEKNHSVRKWRLQESFQNYKQVFEYYGHRLRVWTLEKIRDFIASASEDTTCKICGRDANNYNS